MNNPPSSPFMEKVSGAVSGGLSEALERQSPALASAKKYQQRFLSGNRIKASRRVYISDDMFEIISKIASAIGKDTVSVGNYVTEIVREHLERNRDSINAIYLTNTQPLF